MTVSRTVSTGSSSVALRAGSSTGIGEHSQCSGRNRGGGVSLSLGRMEVLLSEPRPEGSGGVGQPVSTGGRRSLTVAARIGASRLSISLFHTRYRRAACIIGEIYGQTKLAPTDHRSEEHTSELQSLR